MKKKKIIVKLEEPKRRNPIARILCTQGQFKNKVFKNKKKLIKPFDLKKEDLSDQSKRIRYVDYAKIFREAAGSRLGLDQ